MRNLLALAALILVGFVGLGWYLGWYKIQSAPTADGHRQIQIDLNTNKIKTDVAKGEERVHELITPKDGSNAQNANNKPMTSGTTTGFQFTSDGSFVFPASGSAPVGGGTTLPPPK